MSKLIIVTGCILLLLGIFVQYPLEMRNHNVIAQADVIVNAAKEQAKQEGYFTPEIVSEMRKNLVELLDVTPEDVQIDVTQTPKYRSDVYDERELISYQIGIPIKRLVAANKLWRISDEDNQRIHYISGAVASERLPEGATE